MEDHKVKGRQPEVAKLYELLQLEAMIRDADTVRGLHFFIVNELRKLIPYRQAFILAADTIHKDIFRLQAASSIAVIDRNSPFSQWLERTISNLSKTSNMDSIRQIDASSCPDSIKDDWKEHSLPFVLWCPLTLRDGRLLGGLWLARETPWKDGESTLVNRIADTCTHAWFALLGKEKLKKSKHYERAIIASIAFIIFSFFVIPVRISALAPVEVVAKNPVIVSAPIDGVISRVLYSPNSVVKTGGTLVRYEDTSLRNQYEIAEKTLAVARAEYQQVAQGAFNDIRSKAQVSLAKAQVELKQAERDYALELLQQVEIKAQAPGILIYSDKADWVGRPVQVGQQIMQIADPKEISLRIYLPVEDSIFLVEGADAKIFLDVDPLKSIDAVVTYSSYEAEVTPDNILAYRIEAEFKDPNEIQRIGLQGTAKIYGERVSLFFYLFRRPLATLRQIIGL